MTKFTYILTTIRDRRDAYWTGRAGPDWLSNDRSDAFEVSQVEAHRKVDHFKSLMNVDFDATRTLPRPRPTVIAFVAGGPDSALVPRTEANKDDIAR